MIFIMIKYVLDEWECRLWSEFHDWHATSKLHAFHSHIAADLLLFSKTTQKVFGAVFSFLLPRAIISCWTSPVLRHLINVIVKRTTADQPILTWTRRVRPLVVYYNMVEAKNLRSLQIIYDTHVYTHRSLWYFHCLFIVHAPVCLCALKVR